MASLVKPLEQAMGPGMSTQEFRELVNAEHKELSDINAMQNDAKEGWMACKDLLSGETAADKAGEFITRYKALTESRVWLEGALAASQGMANMQPVPDTPKQGITMKAVETPTPTPAGKPPIEESDFHYELEAMKSLAPAEQFKMLRQSKHIALRSDAKEYLVKMKNMPDIGGPAETMMKAMTFSTGADGILPTDRMAMPMALISALSFFNIMAQPGNLVRFFEAPTPEVASATGQSRGRIRGADIHEVSVASQSTQLIKHSIGSYAEIPREDIRDHGMVSERSERTLDIAIRQEMERQIFAGDNSGTNWRGIGEVTKTAVANIGLLSITTNSVAVLNSGSDREPVAFFERLALELGTRGTFPTVLFADAATIVKVRDSQRAFRYQQNDIERFPFGSIQNGLIPMFPSRYLPENTAYLLDSGQAMDVELGEFIETGISEDVAFKQNAVAIRRTVDGNVAFLMPHAVIQVTGTNNLVAQTP